MSLEIIPLTYGPNGRFPARPLRGDRPPRQGVGQGYQATDTKLNRQVALKNLLVAFAADPDRVARFQREAQICQFEPSWHCGHP